MTERMKAGFRPLTGIILDYRDPDVIGESFRPLTGIILMLSIAINREQRFRPLTGIIRQA